MSERHSSFIPNLGENTVCLYLIDTNSCFNTAVWLYEMWPLDPGELNQSWKQFSGKCFKENKMGGTSGTCWPSKLIFVVQLIFLKKYICSTTFLISCDTMSYESV